MRLKGETEMTKVNGNGGNNQNLEALKAYYEALNTKKADKETKAAETKAAGAKAPQEVQASALDAAAAQIWGIQLTKGVDKSEAATAKRLEQAFASSSFMASLNDLQGVEEDFTAYAMANIKGVDREKLAKYMSKPLSAETASAVCEIADKLTV